MFTPDFPYYTRVLQAPKTESFGNASGPVLVWMRGNGAFENNAADTHVQFLIGFYQSWQILPWFVMLQSHDPYLEENKCH